MKRDKLSVWLPLATSIALLVTGAAVGAVLSIGLEISQQWARDLLPGKPMPPITNFYYTYLAEPTSHPILKLCLIPALLQSLVTLWALRKSVDQSTAQFRILGSAVIAQSLLISLAFVSLAAMLIPFVHTGHGRLYSDEYRLPTTLRAIDGVWWSLIIANLMAFFMIVAGSWKRHQTQIPESNTIDS
ncbi:MAG: hypothetical protein AAGD22_05970 [Verrucomicrobiota bacterium]